MSTWWYQGCSRWVIKDYFVVICEDDPGRDWHLSQGSHKYISRTFSHLDGHYPRHRGPKRGNRKAQINLSNLCKIYCLQIARTQVLVSLDCVNFTSFSTVFSFLQSQTGSNNAGHPASLFCWWWIVGFLGFQNCASHFSCSINIFLYIGMYIFPPSLLSSFSPISICLSASTHLSLWVPFLQKSPNNTV